MTAEATVPSPTAASDKLDKRVLVVAGVVVLGSIMSILDITVVNVGMQTFAVSFHKTLAQVAWVSTGYTLALATVIPLSGWAAERFGTKRLYLAAIAFFAIGSAVCTLAQSLEMLVAFRVIQGFGGGMLMPLGMTILTRAAGPERVGRVMAVLGIPMLVGPIMGPILGGWLIDAASWHWIFLINVPIGVIGFVYASLVLDKDVSSTGESFDFLGMAMLSPGLACLLYGVSAIPGAQSAHGTMWTDGVIIPGAIGIALVLAFVPWALSRANKNPLMDLRLLANRNMTVAVIAILLFCVAFFGSSILLPNYFQEVRAASPLKAGVLLAPQGLGAMLTMPMSGSLSDRVGAGRVVLPGVAVIVVSLVMWTQVTDTTAYWYLLLALFVMGLGMGCTMMPVFSAALATLREHSIARGSTLVNIIQQVAGAVGAALFSVLVTNQMLHKVAAAKAAGTSIAAATASSYAHVFIVATILVALVLIPAFFLPRSKKDEIEATPIHLPH